MKYLSNKDVILKSISPNSRLYWEASKEDMFNQDSNCGIMSCTICKWYKFLYKKDGLLAKKCYNIDNKKYLEEFLESLKK
jgi:hypothetical protein